MENTDKVNDLFNTCIKRLRALHSIQNLLALIVVLIFGSLAITLTIGILLNNFKAFYMANVALAGWVVVYWITKFSIMAQEIRLLTLQSINNLDENIREKLINRL